jgi:hypothetical protein
MLVQLLIYIDSVFGVVVYVRIISCIPSGISNLNAAHNSLFLGWGGTATSHGFQLGVSYIFNSNVLYIVVKL